MNSLMSNPEQFASCHSELLSALEVYSRHGHMALSVAGTATFRIRSLVQRPTTIYLIPPREAAQREAYRPWMQLIISSALAALVQHGTNEPGKQILFMLEEFGNIGKIPNMDKVLNLYRAYGLRAWLILQHRSQIYATYKKEDAESIEDACATIQVLTLNHEHAKILSEKIGTVGITKGGVSGGGGGSHTGTRAVNYEKRPLLEPAEIEELSRFWRNAPIGAWISGRVRSPPIRSKAEVRPPSPPRRWFGSHNTPTHGYSPTLRRQSL
jgi:type IV secretory pathway TraG/TraD family ATPase VirD4